MYRSSSSSPSQTHRVTEEELGSFARPSDSFILRNDVGLAPSCRGELFDSASASLCSGQCGAYAAVPQSAPCGVAAPQGSYADGMVPPMRPTFVAAENCCCGCAQAPIYAPQRAPVSTASAQAVSPADVQNMSLRWRLRYLKFAATCLIYKRMAEWKSANLEKKRLKLKDLPADSLQASLYWNEFQKFKQWRAESNAALRRQWDAFEQARIEDNRQKRLSQEYRRRAWENYYTKGPAAYGAVLPSELQNAPVVNGFSSINFCI